MYLWVLYLLSAASNAMPDQSSLASSPGVESFNYLNGFSILEGDILTFDFEEDGKNAIRSRTYLWENGTIPYTWGDEFNDGEKKRILEAMRTLESKTCISFVEWKGEKSFINFQKQKKGCFATVGRLRELEGPLPVNLQSPACLRVLGTIEHELLHVIGLHHEQSRPDRDNFINIHWQNVNPYRKRDFSKRTEEQVTTFGLPYDYGSIMHYSSFAFSKNGKPTITAKRKTSMHMGQREAPSAGDIEKVRKMYNCNTTENSVGTEASIRVGKNLH